MKTVVLDVRPPNKAMADFVRVWKTGKAEKVTRISFATPELLWKVLTAKRWQLLKATVWSRPSADSRSGALTRGAIKMKAGEI